MSIKPYTHKGFTTFLDSEVAKEIRSGLSGVFGREFGLAEIRARIFRSSPWEAEDWEIGQLAIETDCDPEWLLDEARARNLIAPFEDF